ncbi:MAG: hypothetical protein Q6352_010730 [Candidatus Freyrarchaeum guaymaensis]|nr:hypothetical protein [Candidatus Sigynarchaeota archaeon]
MHFLTKLIKNQVDDLVHRRFIKFSTGEFEGPTIKVNVKKSVIDFRASFEYQDFVLEFIINRVPDVECTVKGNIFSSQDIGDELKRFSIKKVKRSGLVYKAAVKNTLSSEKLRELLASIGGHSTLLLSVRPTSDSWKISMKANFPKPMAEPKDPTSFCRSTIKRTEENLQDLIEELAPDFMDEISLPFKSLKLTNKYHIGEIIFPENKEKLTPKEIRAQSKRKGVLSRTLEIDGRELKKEIEFIA